MNAAFQVCCLANGSGRTTSLSELEIDERLYRRAFYLNDDVDDGRQQERADHHVATAKRGDDSLLPCIGQEMREESEGHESQYIFISAYNL